MEEENYEKKNLKKQKVETSNKAMQDREKQNKNRIRDKLKNVDSNLIEEDQKEDQTLEKKIQHQLEFYLGDVNLRKDKFLLEQIKKNDKGYIDIGIFLNFNKIKLLLKSVQEHQDKLNMLAEAVISSEVLKVNNSRTKIKRKIPFTEHLDQKAEEEIDKRTVYIENFPEDINHEMIGKIFSKCGKVLHVSLPKYAESKTFKGFGFVEFSNEDEAIQAIKKYDNTVAEELVQNSLFKGKINPLKVMPKTKWLELKEEFKKIKRELVQHLQGDNEYNPSAGAGTQGSKEITKGCLIKLQNLPSGSLDKAIIRTAIISFYIPKYVDYRKGTNECIVRFDSSQAREEFLSKINEEGLIIQNKKVDVSLIEGEEEENYISRIKHYQEHLRNRNNSGKFQSRQGNFVTE